jgi:hypothetical protein
VKGLNRHFFNENIQIANKHIKRCSTFSLTGDMQIKSTMGWIWWEIPVIPVLWRQIQEDLSLRPALATKQNRASNKQTIKPKMSLAHGPF